MSKTCANIKLYSKKDVEQSAEADRLAVMLFASVGFVVNQKGIRRSKKPRQLAQAA